MPDNNGWIKLHRSLLNWEWYDDHNTCRLFLHLLMIANHEDKKWQGILIPRGSIATGLQSLSKSTGISTQSVRTSLTKLKSTNNLTIKSTNKYSIISINNWCDYQETNNQTNKRLTNNQQTTNNKQEYKNIRIKEIDTYMSLFNKFFGTSYKPTKGRVDKLSLRLKSFSIEQIEQAVKNLSTSAFHTGKNDRGWKADPDFLLRNDEQIDKWLNFKSDAVARPIRYVKLLSEEE